MHFARWLCVGFLLCALGVVARQQDNKRGTVVKTAQLDALAQQADAKYTAITYNNHDDDIEYFPVGPEFKLQKEVDAEKLNAEHEAVHTSR